MAMELILFSITPMKKPLFNIIFVQSLFWDNLKLGRFIFIFFLRFLSPHRILFSHLTVSIAYGPVAWMLHPFIHPLTHPSIHPFTHPVIHPLIHTTINAHLNPTFCFDLLQKFWYLCVFSWFNSGDDLILLFVVNTNTFDFHKDRSQQNFKTFKSLLASNYNYWVTFSS